MAHINIKPYLLILIFTLVSCVRPSGYKQFYSTYIDTHAPEAKIDLELLKEGEPPEVLGTSDFDKDTNTLFLKSYVVIGESNFNGKYEDIRSVAKQAISVGATVVLVNAKYTNTLAINSALFLPTTSTTYHSGSISHYGTATTSGTATYNNYSPYYRSANATYQASTTYQGNASYSGTSTTHGTQVVPYTVQQRRYDQRALYFAKKINKSKLGMSLEPITDEQKKAYGKEFGVYISSVTEGSPAHRANIQAGDLLYKVNGENAYGTTSAEYWIGKMNLSDQGNVVTVIRYGEEISLQIMQQ